MKRQMDEDYCDKKSKMTTRATAAETVPGYEAPRLKSCKSCDACAEHCRMPKTNPPTASLRAESGERTVSDQGTCRPQARPAVNKKPRKAGKGNKKSGLKAGTSDDDSSSSPVKGVPGWKPTDDLMLVPEALQPPPRPGGAKKPKKAGEGSRRGNQKLGTGDTDTSSPLKNVGRWKPTDDLMLITAVLQTNDLTAVYKGTKFSCKFSLSEIHQRWYCLLYDKAISSNAIEIMKHLDAETIVSIQSKTLYSKAEEGLLKAIPATSQPPPSLATFETLLIQHPDVFHPARTPRVLLQHWQLMKQYRLLLDQKPLPAMLHDSDYKLSFSDVEDSLGTMEEPELGSVMGGVAGPSSLPGAAPGMLAEAERERVQRSTIMEMRLLENEIPKLQVLVESVTGISPPDFDSQTLAVLRGRMVRYLMRSREITLGRNAKNNVVDIDVSLEGPAWKVSRKQATVRMRPTGEFMLANDGQRPMYIDGKPLLPGSKGKLEHNSVLEISCLRFIFLINQDLINTVRNEAVKLMLV